MGLFLHGSPRERSLLRSRSPATQSQTKKTKTKGGSEEWDEPSQWLSVLAAQVRVFAPTLTIHFEIFSHSPLAFPVRD